MSRSPTERLLLTADGAVDASGQAWPDFAAWCAAHAGARLALLAGPDRMHSMLVPDDLPLADDDALLGYARLQFTHYFGPAAQTWPLAAWPRGACALADGDLAALRATAAAHRVRITSLRPSWTLLPLEDGDCALVDGGMLTWLRRRDGHLVELQQRHADDELLNELQGARVVHAKDLLAEPGGQATPDFIAQPSQARPLLWAWAATAAAACVLVALQAQSQHEEGQRLAEQAAVLDRIARPAATQKAKPANPAARARAWAVSRQLGTDWPALWADVERALPPGLQLAALDLDRQALRLEGQAGDPDAVTRLVDRLAMDAASGDEVVLTRLQRPESPADTSLLRFELVRRSGVTR
ncbi:PilN domain-containing protein [Roseateles sp. BYS78W]|uniref:PilN domain-containing protein n=1 Tax=Pelomonas candidula TaxID=3299025 RepID=A0ABW7HIT5_9BURK